MTDNLFTTDDESARLQRVAEARNLLTDLGFDPERSNERSALVLLALLDLTPHQPWASAATPLLRTVEIMDWLRSRYNKDYKANTRETIRRKTLHQFIEAGLVIPNPDSPTRAVNSPKSCYQVAPEALALIRTFQQPEWEVRLREYLVTNVGLKAMYANAREMHRIPVTLPDGTPITLSPGGQNILIVEIINEFCPRYTPGGHVLYVGDADDKWSVFQRTALEGLGVTVDTHGKMPDLVVYLTDRNWLVLIEAASSHGPVDAKRHRELKELFAGATAGLVFISCFPTRVELRKYLADIAWETDVWCADNPTHLIHFNGERFLGPYDEPVADS
ncbi:BsuBI/PstI family type II restriction endonuclease [Yinghuangia sp. YIM S09857]|uniref:BsuBI/PstI family type II restriction endonuclease n=1 Tax=Yinghuangia sp. YIM S09857 TaxID=3436929 RepID=UPI003F53D41C